MPRLITSMPAARLASTLRASSANRYGGIFSSRRLGLMGRLLGGMAALDEFIREVATEYRYRPTGQRHLQILPHLDLELAAVEQHRDRRAAFGDLVGDGGTGGAGAAGRCLPHAALEDPRPDPIRGQSHVP